MNDYPDTQILIDTFGTSVNSSNKVKTAAKQFSESLQAEYTNRQRTMEYIYISFLANEYRNEYETRVSDAIQLNTWGSKTRDEFYKKAGEYVGKMSHVTIDDWNSILQMLEEFTTFDP